LNFAVVLSAVSGERPEDAIAVFSQKKSGDYGHSLS